MSFAAKARTASASRSPSLTGYRRGDAVAAHLRLNQQVTGAQQTLAFLGRATAQLAQVKSAVVAQISGRAQDEGELAERIAQFDATWKTRSAATEGRLSAQLGYGEAGSARQAFRIRGLDARSSQADKPETLVFHTSASAAPIHAHRRRVVEAAGALSAVSDVPSALSALAEGGRAAAARGALVRRVWSRAPFEPH
nr:hypothetical protein [Trinickia terrae]